MTGLAGDGDGAVMSVDNRGDNGQSETGAARGRRIRCAHPACVTSGKPLEDATGHLRRMPGPLSVTVTTASGPLTETSVHLGTEEGMGTRVRQQVDHP